RPKRRSLRCAAAVGVRAYAGRREGTRAHLRCDVQHGTTAEAGQQSMSMGQGMGNWHAIRSFTQDRSVAKQKLAKGTVTRIARFAKPYRKLIAILLGFLSIDAAIGI